MRSPRAIIKDGKVVNAEQLRRYWRDRSERDYIIRRGMFQDLERDSKEIQESQPEPPWTKRQFDIINQLRGQMIHLEKKVIELYKKEKVDKRYTEYDDSVNKVNSQAQTKLIIVN